MLALKTAVFVETTKSTGALTGDNSQLQNDLHSLEHWSEKWLLKFNTEICHKMSIGHNLLTAYYMTDVNGAKQVEKVAEEKDLGILITDEMK